MIERPGKVKNKNKNKQINIMIENIMYGKMKTKMLIVTFWYKFNNNKFIVISLSPAYVSRYRN